MSKTFLHIDELALDKELIRQPGLYFKHASRLADARTELDNAKNNLEVVAAEVETNVRRHPGKYRIDAERVTEGMIKSAVAQAKEYVAAMDKVIQAQHKMRIHEAVVTAIEHKRSSLTRLVELKQMDYFSEASNRSTREKNEHRAALHAEAVRRTMKKER